MNSLMANVVVPFHGLVTVVIAPISAFVILTLANAVHKVSCFARKWVILTYVLMLTHAVLFAGLFLFCGVRVVL